jgi:hypothetical protein
MKLTLANTRKDNETMVKHSSTSRSEDLGSKSWSNSFKVLTETLTLEFDRSNNKKKNLYQSKTGDERKTNRKLI